MNVVGEIWIEWLHFMRVNVMKEPWLPPSFIPYHFFRWKEVVFQSTRPTLHWSSTMRTNTLHKKQYTQYGSKENYFITNSWHGSNGQVSGHVLIQEWGWFAQGNDLLWDSRTNRSEHFFHTLRIEYWSISNSVYLLLTMTFRKLWL